MSHCTHCSDDNPIPVAIKELNEGVSEKARVHFLQEADLMTQLCHPNVVSLIGAILDSTPICIVMELCESSLLHRTRVVEFSVEQQMGMCIGIASGCEFVPPSLIPLPLPSPRRSRQPNARLLVPNGHARFFILIRLCFTSVMIGICTRRNSSIETLRREMYSWMHRARVRLPISGWRAHSQRM